VDDDPRYIRSTKNNRDVDNLDELPGC